LAERQWGTVREDYSADGTAWDYFPHDQARSRAYRWGEDGLLGISDRHGMLCFSIALWNGKDPILKERLFGLTNSQGNHGEDVKECYFYLDSTPTHSYMKALYKYPHAAYPYEQLIDENHRRDHYSPEFEIWDTGVFDEDRYFDVSVEYAKATEDNVALRVQVKNCGPETAELTLLPQVWFRNRWSWSGGYRPALRVAENGAVEAEHPKFGEYFFHACDPPKFLFTENETNTERLFDSPNAQPYVKDAFHRYIVNGETEAVNPAQQGSKVGALYRLTLAAGESQTFCFTLGDNPDPYTADDYEKLFLERSKEANEFYEELTPGLPPEVAAVQRQAFAGLLWSKQYFHYDVYTWLNGDSLQPPPPASRRAGRNCTWGHFLAAEVLSMPDKWEYPWFASWDLAFHCIPMALIDPAFAKFQLTLLLREWYMHPNGQIPAYEWAFSDVNPPVHAWAAWRIYRIEQRATGKADLHFLESVFHKLLLNFTWWVSRKDPDDHNVFQGGFLGLDNIGVFDRNQPLPDGSSVEQSDGTSWMAMFCLNMLAIALELAAHNAVYENIASKFLEHFLYIAHSINNLGEDNLELWDEEDGFYYDIIHREGAPLEYIKVRSMVGLIPLFATTVLEPDVLKKFPNFKERIDWLLQHRPEFAQHIMSMTSPGQGESLILSLADRDKLERIFERLLDEEEFLSPYGIRSLSRAYKDQPYTLCLENYSYTLDYEPAESTSGTFGGNSNWRGPIWFPVNFLLIESIQRLDVYYGSSLKVELPARSGNLVCLSTVAMDLEERLLKLFIQPKPGESSPSLVNNGPFTSKSWENLHLYHEYFHGDTGRGLGASHQTGWTSLIAKVIQQLYVTAYADKV
jgi:hypothetical protein